MLTFKGKQIYLACGHTDMRKALDGLGAIVQNSFELDPCSPAIFVFCNRKRNRIKILEWSADGFWLYMKRLDKGNFRWPAAHEDEKTMILSHEELSHLLNGPGLDQKLRRKQVVNRIVI